MARLAPLIIVATLLTAWTTPHVLARSAHGQLVIAPLQVHPGGTLFLSGSGFAPRSSLHVQMRCGKAPMMHEAGGPVTNARGQFVAFTVSSPRMRTARSESCMATVLGQHLLQAHASYQLVGTNRALAACALRMCLKVTAILVRLRNYAQGNIAVSGWPGATADVTVIEPNGTLKRHHLVLDWRGAAALRLHIAPGLRKGVKAHVLVQARLGRITGVRTAPFGVLPGGR